MTGERERILAAVVIGRNEEAYIGQCLKSVLRAVASVGGAEVVMVDSCSSDRTVDIALAFPVRVVELRHDAPLSPALGRLVGERLTCSRHILFVDGDTEIDPTWVRAAVDYLEEHLRVGGVAGKLRELYYVDGRLVGENPDCFGHKSARPEEVDQLGGNAIYRRAALVTAGSFNPYIVSYEECELAERMRQRGSTVVRLPLEVGIHRTGPTGTLRELRRRWRDNLIKGYGQTLRVAIWQGTFPAHARRMKRYLQFEALLAMGLGAAMATVVSGRPVFAISWLVLFTGLLAAFMGRSRSVTKPLRLFADWAFWSVPLVLGFVERPRDPRALAVESLVLRVREGSGVVAAPLG